MVTAGKRISDLLRLITTDKLLMSRITVNITTIFVLK